MIRFLGNVVIDRRKSTWSEDKYQSMWRRFKISSPSRTLHQRNLASFSASRFLPGNAAFDFNLCRVYNGTKKPCPGYSSLSIRLLSQKVSPDTTHAPPQRKLNGHGVCDNFFESAQSALAEITNAGAHLSASRLSVIVQKLLQKLQENEQIFCQWASSKIGFVCSADIHRRSKLTQILFAPTRLQIDPERNASAILGKHSAHASSSDDLRRKGKKGGDRYTDTKVFGLGLTPAAFINNGHPSLSRDALQMLLDNVRVAPHSSLWDAELVSALEALIRAKELKTRINKAKKSLLKIREMENRLHLQHQFSKQTVGAVGAWRELALGRDALGAVSAEPGNKLLVLHFDRALLWALAHLSGCRKLRQRVESGGDLTAAGAILMYEGIEDNIAQGIYISDNSQSVGGVRAVSSLKELFPVAYNIASRVDSAFRYGGGVGGISLIRAICGCGVKEAQELRMRWYSGHPGVEQWHKGWREKAMNDKMVETVMGQKIFLHGAISSDRNTYAKLDRMLTEGMRSVIHGTAIEAITNIVIRLVRNEVLRTHGWRVVFVADKWIVLEGPERSIDHALPVIRSNFTYPLGVEDPIRANIEVEIVSCFDDLSRLSIEL